MLRILVPVDFSETSKNALHYAVHLFKDFNLEITILNVYGAHSTALMMKSIDEILIKDAKRQISDLIKSLESEASDVTFKVRLAKNYAVSTIADLGNSNHYDLIVMGTKGVSGLKEVFMGSVAGGVVSKTSAPVIVVPTDYSFKTIDQVVFAIGDDKLSDPSVLNVLKQITELNKSQLEVLHISTNGTPEIEQIIDALNNLNPKFTHKQGNGDLNEELNNHIETNGTDLICLLRTKKDFLERIFTGSVTLKQTFNCPIPLLIIHN